jgi:SAM-dependent methyltransferase
MWRIRRNREGIYNTREYWDAKASEYQGHAISMWPNNHLNSYYHREQVLALERLLPNVRGWHVLDVGCGIGRISRYFAARNAVVLGIDFSEKTLAIARQIHVHESISYRVQSIFDVVDQANFDAAFSWGAVTMACRNRAELAEAMQRIRRALKPGGVLLLGEPIHGGFLHRTLKMRPGEFLDVLRENGFQIIKSRDLYFWPVRLALAYIAWPMWLTAAGYYFGRLMIALVGSRAFGDYKLILARVAS